MATELNKISFVDQDFSTAVTQVRNFLNANFPDEFNDYVNNNMGLALIEIIAFAEQNLLWYLNRKINDLYFPTAITPRSVSKLARLLGYKSTPATAAKALVNLTLSDGPYSFPVSINRGFQFQGPNNQVWEYRGNIPVTFDPGDTLVSGVEVVQGETVVNNFVSDGSTNQFFELLTVVEGKFVEGESVTVRVDGELWTEQPVIPFTTEDNYETNLLDFPPVVRFGDSVQGNIPPIGAGIAVEYSITDGFRGRIASDAIGEPVVGLIAQFQDIPLGVEQPSGSVGGDDPEDIRSITTNAPLFQRTQDRAITKGDYLFLSNGFVNVAKADAQIIRGVSGDVTFNTLATSIITQVEAAADGIEQEIEPYVSSMNASVSSMVDTVSAFSDEAKTLADPFITSISGKTDNICTTVDSTIATMRTDIQPFFDAAVSDLGDIDTESLTLITTVETIIDIKNGAIGTLLDDIETTVAGDPLEAAVDALVASIRTKLIETKTEVSAAVTTTNGTIDTKTDSVEGSLDSIITEVEALSGEIDVAIQPDKDCIASDLGQICLAISGAASGFEESISSDLDNILLQNDNINQVFLDQTSGLVESVSADVSAFLEHADEHLTESCDANLVQIKVLGKDVDRKYVNPLQSTLDDLKVYLEARKDVTHTISTVTGLGDVINADVTIEVRVSENALEDDVVAGISDSLAKSDVEPFGILVERDFDSPLYIWEIDGAIRDTVNPDDIIFLNVKINGPTEFIDEDGNLVPPIGTVIQAGTIVVEALPRFTRTDGVSN